MEVTRFDDAGPFLTEAEPSLLADEARHNPMLGIAGNIRDGLYDHFRLWLVRGGGEVVGAALLTPPNTLVLARHRSPEALAALADAVASEKLPGVIGSVPEADDFAALWSLRTGAGIRTNMRQGVYALERVRPASEVSGSARVAGANDRMLAVRWWMAFAAEAHHDGALNLDRSEVMVDYRLS